MMQSTQDTKQAGKQKAQKIMTRWNVATFDVWGNKRDGWEVNDVYRHSESVEIELTIQKNNAGTEREFSSAYPTNAQIRQTLGLKKNLKIALDGDDTFISVERARDGYPIGEMQCISHKSLSPVVRQFKFIVDLDERGEFNFHVEDEGEKIVYESHNDLGDLDTSTIFQDGFMKDAGDLAGLRDYLASLGIMGKDDVLSS